MAATFPVRDRCSRARTCTADGAACRVDHRGLSCATTSGSRRIALFVALVAVLAQSCIGTRTLSDPTLQIRTERGSELGVSTDYGVVFLGRTAQSGPIEITAVYGDGPNIESSVIEPLGGGIFTAETEIRLPSVSMSFDDPRPGAYVRVVGRNKDGDWEREVQVAADPRVHGILLPIPRDLQNAPDQVGAGVYVVPDQGPEPKLLVGLVSGRITLKGKDGERSYLTVIGPQELWRLVVHRRDLLQRRHWVYRPDVL
jgi:hypothetical protein